MDGDLSRADRLIAEKQYDEAIRVLSEYIRNNPDDFETARKRLKRIEAFRDEYNAVASELLTTVSSDPGNASKILSLIQRLQSIESPNNPNVQAFIGRIQAIALFTYNRNRLEQILSAGREELARANFEGALALYAGGMDIYRDEFFSAGYGEETENRVRAGIADINAETGGFPAIVRSLEQNAAEMEQSGTGNTSLVRLEEIYGRLIPGLDNLTRSRNVLLDAGNYFDEELARLQADNPEIGDRSFLSFASRLVHGPARAEFPEGMLGAVEGYWNSVMSRAERAALNIAERNYTAGLTGLSNGEYAAAASSCENARPYLDFLLSLSGKWNEFMHDSPSFTLFGVSVPREKFGDFLMYQALDDALSYFVDGADLGRRFAGAPGGDSGAISLWQSGSLDSAEAERREGQYREGFTVLYTEAETLILEMGGREDEFRAEMAAGPGPDGESPAGKDPLSPLEEARNFIVSLQARIGEEEYGAAVRQYTIANGEFERRVNGRRSEMDQGIRFIEGTTEDGHVVYYPAEGLAIFEGMNAAVSADIEAGDILLERYAAERADILGKGEVSSLYASAREMAASLASLGSRGESLMSAARAQSDRAQTYRQEGDRLFREAQTALAQNNFDTARDRVRQSTERYNMSLELQESASLRAEWGRLVALGNEINRVENEFVIRDVRNYVTGARTNYYAGNFEQAEELLVRAQNRWRRTNVGDDEEVLYWLSLVRNAMSLRSGRIIPATAPLYAEMSQLLSEAKKNYEEGVRYFNSGRRGDGTVKFTEARQKTREVKIMFPLNEDAGLLELRMDQVVDPRAFEQSFEQRMRDAIAGTRRKSMEAFADLQNLAKINPRYPGMAGIITQAEIDMGFRPPPPNPADLARSAELTADARRVIEGNLSGQYEASLVWLDQALRLNPNNTEATRQKDILLTRISGRGVVVFDRKTEDEYQRAVREYQQGNYLGAFARIEQLLQDPRNRNSTLILELHRRLQSLL
jgi:tetratricopeptide (TPR) repeat protein